MHSHYLLASVLAAISTATLAPRGALAQSSSATGFVGCYADSASRVLGYGAYSSSAGNTPGMCQAACNNAGYIYSGTEYGTECFCGNTLSNPADGSACDSPCAGDASQTCGGDWHLSVYEGSGVPSASATSSAAAPAATSAAAFTSGGAYLGCYVDAGSTGTRTLNYGAYTSSNNTNELCQSTCAGLGYAYSGTEYGVQCFCDNTLHSGVTSDGDCNVACPGNGDEMCGGSWRLTVYSTSGGSGAGSGSSGTFTSATVSSAAASSTSSLSHTASSDVSPIPVPSTTIPAVSVSVVATTVVGVAPTSTTTTTTSGGGFLGCYTDNGSSGARTLNYGAYSSTNNTNEMCQSTCASLGYAYSGTEYGTECFCDNSINASMTADANCNFACAGSPSEMCGGNWLLTVYSTGSGSGLGSGTVTSSAGGSTSTFSAGRNVSTSSAAVSAASYVSSSARTSTISSTFVGPTSALSSSRTVTSSSTAVPAPSTSIAKTTATSSSVISSPSASQTTASAKTSVVISSTSSAALTTSKTATTSFSSSSAALTTSKAATTSSSSAAPTATGSGYVGCYLNLTPLASLAYTSTVNTNALCRATCYSKGYAYAATTAGLQCSCAQSIGFAIQVPSLTCNVPCTGDWTQACGGPGSVSMYKTH